MKYSGEILEFTSRLAGCASVDDLHDTLFPSMEELFDADGSVLFYIRGRSRHGRFYKSIRRNIKNVLSDDYHKYYYKLDPFATELRRRAEAGEDPVCASFEVVPPEKSEEYEKSEFYLDFQRHAGTRHLLMFAVLRGTRPMAVFALHKGPDSVDFNQQDLELARKIAPSVTAAIDRANLADETGKSSHIIDFLSVDVFDRGLLILDESYDLEMANIRAMEVLEDIDDFQPVISKVPDIIVESCKELLDTFGGEDTTSRIEFVIPHNGSEIRGYVRLKDTGNHHLMFLVFLNPEEQIALNTEQLKRFKLTPRESEIARSVARGRTDPQIASDIYVSVRTVHNHLRSIYSKTGVRNRTSLIRKLMSVE